MIAPEAGLPASGAFAFLALRGKFRREKCNMLQKSLAEIFIRLSNHPVKLILEAKKNFFDKIMKNACKKQVNLSPDAVYDGLIVLLKK